MKHIRIRGSTSRALLALTVAAALMAPTLFLGRAAPVSATDGTLTIQPYSGTISSGTDFTVAIVQNASVNTSGIQADLTFNRKVLQIVSVSRGSAYPANPDATYPAGAPWLCAPACGTLIAGISPQTLAQAIAEANGTTGVLENVSVYYGTPAGEPAVPPGDRQAILVTFQAIGNTGASTALTLSNGELIDEFGVDPPPTLVNSSVTLATPTSVLYKSPSVASAAASQSFTLSVMQRATDATSGASVGLMFDPAKLSVTAVARGAAYPADADATYPAGAPWLCSPSCGALTAGVSPQTIPQAISESNLTGFLKGASVYYGTPAGEPSVLAGTAEAIKVTFTALVAISNVNDAIQLVNPEMLKSDGSSLMTAAEDADNCPGVKEVGGSHSAGGQRDPANNWDFFDVPVPYSSVHTTVGMNRAITAQDVLTVRGASGLLASDPAYNAQYDRLPSLIIGEGWHSRAPSGAISAQDVLVARDSSGDLC